MSTETPAEPRTRAGRDVWKALGRTASDGVRIRAIEDAGPVADDPGPSARDRLAELTHSDEFHSDRIAAQVSSDWYATADFMLDYLDRSGALSEARQQGAREAGMIGRDLLLEFVQWCVDNPELAEDITEDPLAAVVAIDEFIEANGG